MTPEAPNPDDAPQPAQEKPSMGMLADRALEQQEVPEVLEFFRRNGMSILVGAALAISAFLGVSAYTNYHATARQKASAALFSSKSAEDLQKLIGDYGSTPAAPLALLSLAQQHFDEGQYDMARHEYADFQARYPQHDLLAVSELGIAQCLEAGGQTEDALTAFQDFEKKHDGHFMTPVAVFGTARCLEQVGRLAEAKAVYEDYIAAHAKDDPWSAKAETALLFVNKQIRAAAGSAAP